MVSVTLSGNIVDLFSREINFGEVMIEAGKIASINITKQGEQEGAPYLLPGFIDSHVHIESSMLVPSEFAKLAVVHGTVATVSDPHEIANVLGTRGIWYMIDNAKLSPVKFHFGASSCVPACARCSIASRRPPRCWRSSRSRREAYYVSASAGAGIPSERYVPQYRNFHDAQRPSKL